MTDQTASPTFWDLERYRVGSAAPAPEEEGPQSRLRLGFDGDSARVFWVALKGVVLTILTLGIYRFWMLTRMRRLYWCAIRIDGDGLEYTGRGIEKLLGFLLALVVLAAYLGAINLGLTFVGLSFAANDPVALQATLNISLLATLPFVFYAIYRGHRYILARTRWRGIRFGLAPGAWGYVWRALALSLLTLATLGLAYPYQQFKLAKYVTDRAHFGDLRFAQHGSWGELFAQWIWIYVVGGFAALVIWGMAGAQPAGGAAMLASLVVMALAVGFFVAFYRYQIAAFRILWSNRSLGEARFENDLSPGRVLGIYVGGGIGVAVCTGLVGAILGTALFAAVGQMMGPEAMAVLAQPAGPDGPSREQLLAAWPVLGAGALTYLLIFGIAFAFTQIFITLRVLRAKTEGMILVGAEALEAARQRAHDSAEEAGGFADALGVDIGAGL